MPFALSHPQDTAEREEGVPFYQLSTYTLQHSDTLPPRWQNFHFSVRAFKVLPPCDAVGLLSGSDSTGLVVWSGALALVEWLLHHPDRLDAAVITSAARPATAAGTDASTSEAHIIELGCGSGIATAGLYALLSRRRKSLGVEQHTLAAPTHLWATDGNPECVELAQRNLNEQCSANRDDDLSCGVTASAALLPWGDDGAIEQLLGGFLGGASSSFPPAVTVMSADVLYDAAAVPLLVSTVAKVADLRARAYAPGDSEKSLQWWLAYTPRSLTRAGNECIYQMLVDSFAERGWAYDVFPLPEGAVITGFEERRDCDTPALRGCILMVRVRA
ncbi:putative methyltransferase [Leptomonas seymouri]|uniref:Putative methyltransferase n=1 Tax=Leptomonas seymouri TaxID=5684 RepID=A0A0N1PCI3_LEPSE|nr:putative methyltransferase [Leptomonas seymouri]|eukprot:KPI87548.1 putative methyltransferase [Leptomonas seymouri]